MYKIRQTTIEMLKDRGYEVEDNVKEEEFNIMLENRNIDYVDKENKAYVFFFLEFKNFSKKDLENTYQNVIEKYNENIKIIIILKEKYNNAVEKELLSSKYKNIEIFLHKHLIINVSKHVMQPIFIPLNELEIQEVLQKYSCNINNLPRMFINDPIARYYGMKSGSVFKIIRSSPNAGEGISYRLVK